MPQESLRSVVYRSFVTCEDPRGVVEGKTIRISKSDSTKMGSRKTEKEKQSKNSKEKDKEKEKMSSCKTSASCYQLVEVKNGARKLNEAIDSWSKGGSFRGQPKDIAKDLLKGALDLQESLMMLGKLQEVSCMAKKSSEELFGKIGSNRFESFRNYDLGYEQQRNITNGSSRDCYSELRDVIREGLSKQNLLPNKSYEETAFAGNEGLSGKRKLQLSPDKASTSSSRSSSMVYSTHEFTSSESFSSRVTEEKPKGSSLIAKLMGLEEFPSKPLPSSPRKQLDISSRTRPKFDVDLPNAKKQQVFVKKLDQEHMTLDEIIEMMQSKGLLRSNKSEIKQTSKRFGDDAPPIVLMKPQRLGPDNQKVKSNANSIRKLHQEKAKAEVKAVKNKGNSPSNKQKALVPAATKPQQKQEMEKKIDKIQKMAPRDKRRPVEHAKSTNLVLKNASSKQVKPQRNALPNPISKQTSSSASSTNKSSTQKKNSKIEKEVIEPLPTIIHEVLQTKSSNEEKTKDSEEINNARQQSLCKACEGDSHGVTDDVMTMDLSETRNNYEENGVSYASEQKARILKSLSSFQDSESVSSELLQDCINELLEHETRRKKPIVTIFMLTSRACVSEDHVTREIVKGVENLRNYNKFVKESCNADMVSGLLERDLCWSTLGGTWSTGWKDGCTLDEIEEAVLDLEKMVLSKLIDDILMELVPYKQGRIRVEAHGKISL